MAVSSSAKNGTAFPVGSPVESLLLALPEPTIAVQVNGTVVLANKAATELFQPTALVGSSLRRLCSEPDKLDFLCRRWGRSTDATPGSVAFLMTNGNSLKCRVLGARLAGHSEDGALVWVRITPTERANSRFVALGRKLHAFAGEVHRREHAEEELRKRNELLVTQKQLLELIVQGVELKKILESLVETMQRHTNPGAAISILLLDEDGHLRHGAAPGLPPDYTKMIDGLAIGPAVGSCGTAAFRKEPVFVGDILEHPYWAQYRRAALLSGMRACWSSPIMSQDDVVLGTFALYYREPHPKVNQDAHVVELCTKTASIAIQRDRLERKRVATENALRKTETLAAAGRLAATVAHELNNPLEAVTNLVYLAKMNPELPESVKELLTIADQEIARASHIAHRTVGFYRANSSPQSVNLSDLVRDVMQLYSRKLANKNLVVKTRIKPEVTVWAADGEVRQVVSNLVANAIDACPENGTVYVRVAQRKSMADVPGGRLLVGDNGSGIAQHIRSYIFDPFFTTKRDVGTGLGLWISKGIAEKHAGTLRFRSSVGARHGTVFSLFIPREATKVSVTA